MGKAGTYDWKKVVVFLNKYLHPTECRYFSYAGLFVTYFGTPTKWKKNYSYFAHYHSIIRLNTVVHVFAYLSKVAICKTLFIQSRCNLENNQDLSKCPLILERQTSHWSLRLQNWHM